MVEILKIMLTKKFLWLFKIDGLGILWNIWFKKKNKVTFLSMVLKTRLTPFNSNVQLYTKLFVLAGGVAWFFFV